MQSKELRSDMQLGTAGERIIVLGPAYPLDWPGPSATSVWFQESAHQLLNASRLGRFPRVKLVDYRNHWGRASWGQPTRGTI